MSALATESRPDDYSGHAVYLDWETGFIPWLRGKVRAATVGGLRMPLPPPWFPGQHWALVGPTGEGKSTFAVGLIGTRRFNLALDPKGEDETLEAAGFVRIRQMPLPRDRAAALRSEPREGTDDWLWDRVNKDLPVGLVAGFRARTDEEDMQLNKLMGDAIQFTRRTGGWTLYVDEFELLSSQRMMQHGRLIEQMLITARRDRASVLTSFQAPAWVSKHALRQAGKATIFPTRDRDMIQVVARSMGRDWRIVAQAVDELPAYHSLTIPKQVRAPMIVTVAPKVS